MRTDAPPSGEAQLRAILEAVIQEGDVHESVGLEIKSDVDPTRKGTDIAKVAKCILGMANRMPHDAERFFCGFGVLVLGAGKGIATGVPSGVEHHDLAARLRPYLGSPGPRWDLSRLTTPDGSEVLFIIIEPPAVGDPIYPCRKGYQSGTGDKKGDLADGDIYVRETTNTRKARAHEIDDLVQRAAGATEPQLDLSVALQGQALSVADSDSAIRRLIEGECKSLREELEQDQESQPLPWAATYDILHPGTRRPALQPGEIDAEVREAEARWWRRWPECRDQLYGAVADPIMVTLRNPELLNDPQVIIRFRAARGLPAQELDHLETYEIIPTIDPPAALLNLHRPSRESSTHWENDGEDLVIKLSPRHLRPDTDWTSERDELVVVSKDPNATSLTLEWSLTASNLSRRHEGGSQLSVTRVADVEELFQRWSNRQTHERTSRP